MTRDTFLLCGFAALPGINSVRLSRLGRRFRGTNSQGELGWGWPSAVNWQGERRWTWGWRMEPQKDRIGGFRSSALQVTSAEFDRGDDE